MTDPLNSRPEASSELEPDEFELFDLTVTVEGGSFVCRHHLGQGFKVEGEDLVFPEGGRFSLYARDCGGSDPVNAPLCRSQPKQANIPNSN